MVAGRELWLDLGSSCGSAARTGSWVIVPHSRSAARTRRRTPRCRRRHRRRCPTNVARRGAACRVVDEQPTTRPPTTAATSTPPRRGEVPASQAARGSAGRPCHETASLGDCGSGCSGASDALAHPLRSHAATDRAKLSQRADAAARGDRPRTQPRNGGSGRGVVIIGGLVGSSSCGGLVKISTKSRRATKPGSRSADEMVLDTGLTRPLHPGQQEGEEHRQHGHRGRAPPR